MSDVWRCPQDVPKTTVAPATTPEPKQNEVITIIYAVIGTLTSLMVIAVGVIYFRQRKLAAIVPNNKIRAPTPVSYLTTYRLI